MTMEYTSHLPLSVAYSIPFYVNGHNIPSRLSKKKLIKTDLCHNRAIYVLLYTLDFITIPLCG